MRALLTAKDFPAAQWNDWRWQMANAITTPEGMERWVNLGTAERRAIAGTAHKYRWRVTPYYASLMDKDNPACPVRAQALPHPDELVAYEGAGPDPACDTGFRVTNRVVHKYPDRAILLVTHLCGVYCRHCTRKYHTADREGTYFEQGEAESFEADFAYLERHPEIRDVLLTGGDPLSYSDRRLEVILKRLRAIPHIEIIRIGSRFPVFLPQRITDDLCRILSENQPVWFSTHFNHASELTPDAVQACGRLLGSGVPLQNQTVLLRGVNDTPQAMKALMHALLRARIRPYYLYHCDNVAGVSHFVTSIEKGREIMESLQGHTSGFALPRYVMATPLGKIPLERAYLEVDGEKAVARGYTGQTMVLPHGMKGVPRPLV